MTPIRRLIGGKNVAPLRTPTRAVVAGALALIAAASPLSAAPSVTAALDQQDLQQVFQLLKQNYTEPSDIKEMKVDQASLDSVFEKLHGGASLLAQASPVIPAPPIYTEFLKSPNVGYVRLSSFTPDKGWTGFETQLAEWQKTGLTGVVLDLRDAGTAQDFAGAAQVASYFTPAGSPLFTVQGGLAVPQQVYTNGKTSQLVTLPVIVLVNSQTAGAAEALAAALRRQGNAILLGRSTMGRAALFSDLPLNSGRILRVATAQVILADGTKLYNSPLSPDVPLFVEPKQERDALAQLQKGNASAAIQEVPTRQRLSEAALVRQDNPELDEMLETQLQKKATKPDASAPTFFQDVALVRALDILKAVRFMQEKPAVAPAS